MEVVRVKEKVSTRSPSIIAVRSLVPSRRDRRSASTRRTNGCHRYRLATGDADSRRTGTESVGEADGTDTGESAYDGGLADRESHQCSERIPAGAFYSSPLFLCSMEHRASVRPKPRTRHHRPSPHRIESCAAVGLQLRFFPPSMRMGK